jgi:hypothetical protein
VFAAITLVALVMGAALFFFPQSLAKLPAPANANNPWPWPIGPLALRFLGAAGIALALSAGLITLRPDRPSMLAFFTHLTITGTWLLIHTAVSGGRIDWSRPLAYVWVGGIVLVWLLSLGLARWLWLHTPRSVPPLPPSPSAAGLVAPFISLLTGLVGAVMFFLPDVGRERWPWDLGDNINVQLLGALFLAISTVSFWSWRRPSWYGFDLLYPGAGTFATVALIASFMHWNLFASRPITSVIFVLVYILGAVLGFYPYLRYSLKIAKAPLSTVRLPR